MMPIVANRCMRNRICLAGWRARGLPQRNIQPGGLAMSDRPIQQEADPEVELPAPVWVRPSIGLTKEQLAAAERTRDYHVRKLQRLVTGSERAGDVRTLREH
jgi:hypothetical protein